VRALAALLSIFASLHITVWPDGSDTHHSWTLRCAPAAGTLPHRATACTKLARARDPFAPVPKGIACTQIYGGPQVAVVTGILRRRRIHATFTRTDGCQTARWNDVRFLFPAAAAR
jgi:hypothetical protein